MQSSERLTIDFLIYSKVWGVVRIRCSRNVTCEQSKKKFSSLFHFSSMNTSRKRQKRWGETNEQHQYRNYDRLKLIFLWSKNLRKRKRFVYFGLWIKCKRNVQKSFALWKQKGSRKDINLYVFRSVRVYNYPNIEFRVLRGVSEIPRGLSMSKGSAPDLIHWAT